MGVGCANCWSMLDLHGGEDERRMGDRLAGGPKFGVQVHFDVF